MAEQLTDKEEFSKRISDKRRSRSDTKKGEVGAAWVKQPPKTKKPKGPRNPFGKIPPREAVPYGRRAWAALSRAERDRLRKALERAGSLGKALSKKDKNSKSLTK